MKLALVTETYPPEVNGVAMTLSRLVAGLAARGHEVEVVRPRQRAEARGQKPEARRKKSEIRSQVAEVGTEDRLLRSSFRPRSSAFCPLVSEFLVPGLPIPFYHTLKMGLPVWGALRRRWAAAPPDIVHVATEGPLGLAALRAARRLGLPVTSSFHTNFQHYGRHYGLNKLRATIMAYLRWFHNRTVCTMVPTDELRAQLTAHDFARLVVIARGVDTDLFSPGNRRDQLRASWGAAPGDPVFVYVGRLAAEKNLGLVVETFLLMQKTEPRARCVLVGDGPERPALEKKFPQFCFAGMQRGPELAAHYASADVFVFPSTTETFGNVVTEAMASGLVVLAFDYAAARQHIRTGVNGATVPLGEAGVFLAAAEALLADRGSWPALRAAARAAALDITWDKIVACFEHELLQAQAGKPTGAATVACTAVGG
ncbi:MAG TPA: glycosyltransferase family 1 protein [Opitutaceae bacterium]|nr:glycosyltransferase family 1 protein [Opitutaceae bacterium]